MAKKKSKKKRTLSPEHLAKMQEGRKSAASQRKKVAMLESSGLFGTQIQQSHTEKLLKSVRRLRR